MNIDPERLHERVPDGSVLEALDAIKKEWAKWAKQWPAEYRDRVDELNNLAGRVVADEIELAERTNLSEKAREEIYAHRCRLAVKLPRGYLEDYKERHKEIVEKWAQMVRTGIDADGSSSTETV